MFKNKKFLVFLIDIILLSINLGFSIVNLIKGNFAIGILCICVGIIGLPLTLMDYKSLK